MKDDLLIKYLLGEADAHEQVLVREWIAASPDNEKEFHRFQKIWSESEKLRSTSIVDTDEAWEKFRSRVSPAETKTVTLKRTSYLAPLLRIAAVLFIVAGSWSFYSVFYAGYDTITSGQAVLTETLPDGSSVTLNKGTRLSYKKRFNGSSRNITLESGEVFFDVTPDKSKPFVIEADDVHITVVGTSFNVKHIDKATEVIVETGVVKVGMGAQEVELRKGEKVFIENPEATLRKEASTDLLYNYYRSRMFVADDTPLWRVIDILNEAYDSKIVIEDPKVRDLRLTTTFRDDKLDNILHVIAETFKLRIIREGNKIILR